MSDGLFRSSMPVADDRCLNCGRPHVEHMRVAWGWTCPENTEPAGPDASAPVVLSRPEPSSAGRLPPPRCLVEGCANEAARDHAGRAYRECAEHRPPTPVHPAPWRWVIDDLGESSLRDALGAPLAVNASSAVDADVAELLRAAPEIGAMLRRMSDALRATLQALPSSVKKYPPGAVEAAVDASMFLEALDKRSKGG